VWHIQNMHRTQGNVDDGKTDHWRRSLSNA